jgi:hypothetical protein
MGPARTERAGDPTFAATREITKERDMKYAMMITAAFAAIAVAVPASANHGPGHGLCENPTIRSNEPGQDVVVGTPGDDVIKTRNGGAIIRGLGGDDKICDQKGPGVIFGGSGNDIMNGGHSADELYGQAGFDRARGDASGNDLCRAEREKTCER